MVVLTVMDKAILFLLADTRADGMDGVIVVGCLVVATALLCKSLFWPREVTMGLFCLGDFKLHSGRHSSFKIDCDALSDDDLAALAWQIAAKLPPFGSVEGVPRGGLRLAQALQAYVQYGPPLIADDVLTTGNSMEEQRAGRSCYGIVLFSRTSRLPDWIKAVFITSLGDL
jgi:hypothetical protein